MVSGNSRRRRTKRCVAALPEEMVFNILLFLPADVIYQVMRYVCREWYNIIHSPAFISAHLQKQTVGLILHNCYGIFPLPGYFLNTRNCEVEVKKLKFQFANAVVGSCNGLVLTIGTWRYHNCYVVNPVLNHRLTLPRPCYPLKIKETTLAYAATSGVYKVVDSRCFPRNFILTVGIDEAWRPLEVSQSTCVKSVTFSSSPLHLGGCVYWIIYDVPYVVSLDVETEIYRQIPLPQGLALGGGLWFKLLAMGCSLSLMVRREDYLWEVWLLTDTKSGEWAKLLDVNVQSQKQFLKSKNTLPRSKLDVFGWLQGGEVLLFRRKPATNIVYNVRTGKICSIFEMSTTCHAHVNTLVTLKNSLFP